ncbi:hypothetical protein LCGC14_2135660, partial [marine sediment metagenome]
AAVCLAAAPLAAQEVAEPKASPLDKAKAALRGKRFDVAVKLLGDVPPDQADEATYLKALALFYGGKHAEAVKSADAVIAAREKSPWLRKALFLKANALIQQRKFKEAEGIYEKEANRLLSQTRKKRIAGVIIRFADTLAKKPDPNDVGATPPNYTKAYNLYRRALAMEIGRELRDEVMFKCARTIQLARNYSKAIGDYRAYLAEFDPDWTGNVGSLRRLAGLKREKPKPAGKYPLQARYRLGEAQLLSGDHRSARVNLEDLQKMLLAHRPNVPAGKEAPKLVQLRADTAWLLVRTYRLPNAQGEELDRAVKEARDFCKAYTDDARAVAAAFWIGQAYQAHGRADQAIAAYEAFIDAREYKLPRGEAATAKLDDFGKKSPTQLQDEWRKLALFQIGQIRFGQKKYAEASGAWQRYVTKYPNGSHWAACQRGIIDAEFQVAVDAVADKEYPKARELFEAFLTRHPLDARARQILFTLGQIDYANAQKLADDKADRDKINASYTLAVERWNRLVSKYPGAQESSLALYRIGVIYEEKLGDLSFQAGTELVKALGQDVGVDAQVADVPVVGGVYAAIGQDLGDGLEHLAGVLHDLGRMSDQFANVHGGGHLVARDQQVGVAQDLVEHQGDDGPVDPAVVGVGLPGDYQDGVEDRDGHLALAGGQ